MALRGKHYGEGIVEDLYKLKIDAGGNVIKKHMEHDKKMQGIDQLKFKLKSPAFVVKS